MKKIFFCKCIGFLGFLFFLCVVVFFVSPVATAKALNDNADTISAIDDVMDETPAAKLNLRYTTLVKGKTYTLKVYNLAKKQTVIFKSDNTDIVTVDEDGIITGVDYGETVITAIIKENNKIVDKLTCDVMVGPAAISVKLTKSEITLVVGKKSILKTILQPNNTVEDAKFISLDSTIATVSTGGRVTAKSEGTTKIYTVLDNGKFDICTVNVISEEAYDAIKAIQSNSDSSSDDNDETKTEE